MPPPCRLFVIPARDAPVAAILRRGPSTWYQVIAWDTQRDVFTEGAWFRGRIYEEKCDVSPDGALLLYFCHGGRSRPGYTHAWTAVSRLPWLFALGLWPWGTTYGGGGRFVGKREIVLRTGMPLRAHPDHVGVGLVVSAGDTPVHRSTGIDGTDWSGIDHGGRVIFCRAGRVFRRERDGHDREVADFNDHVPAPIEPPEWATAPLARASPPRQKRSRSRR